MFLLPFATIINFFDFSTLSMILTNNISTLAYESKSPLVHFVFKYNLIDISSADCS